MAEKYFVVIIDEQEVIARRAESSTLNSPADLTIGGVVEVLATR